MELVAATPNWLEATIVKTFVELSAKVKLRAKLVVEPERTEVKSGEPLVDQPKYSILPMEISFVPVKDTEADEDMRAGSGLVIKTARAPWLMEVVILAILVRPSSFEAMTSKTNVLLGTVVVSRV